MKEIICPQCGRPNLTEAKKCWYCQTALEENIKENQENNFVVQKATDDAEEKKLGAKDEKQVDENIPEWLKRIRDLKEADYPPEENDPNWQQQDLFKTEKPQKQKITQPNSKRKKKDDQQLIIKQKKLTKQTKNHDMQKQQATEKPDKDSGTVSDELPNGFTKL